MYLREIDYHDLNFLYKLHQDPEVMKYIGLLRKKEELKSRIHRIRKEYLSTPGLGIWLACLHNTNEAIGWFNLNDLDGNPEIEIGYRLARSFWGKGYACEMSAKLLAYGFKTIGLDQIVAVTVAQNSASIRVLKKSGFQYRRTGWYYNRWVNFYRITSDEWSLIQVK